MHDESDDTTSGTAERTYCLDRREYLKATGATAASVAAGAAATGTATAEDYDTITVPSNTTRRISVGSNEVFENKLIDITASGASVEINPVGNDWIVRNIGIKGVHPGGHYVIKPAVEDHDATGLIENIYAGDGQVERTAKGFCWARYNHRGTIEFRNVNVQHFVDNGLYTTSPGDEEYYTHGRSHIYDSYFYSNNISNCRTGAREDTNGMSHDHVCHVNGCTIVVDSTVPPCEEGCSSPGAQNSRAVWAVNGAVSVKDCDILVTDSEYGDYFQTLHGGYYENDPWQDNRTGSDADTSIPDGVPTTPEEAASGSSGGGGGGGSTSEVAEDFSHDDVPGTYSLDTGAFTTTSTRATSGSYSLQAADSADDDKMILREDMVTSAGNTYELDVYFPSSTDMGFLFGGQSATGFSDYTGYFGIFESDSDEIRLDRWESGSLSNSSAASMTWPLDEWLTVELDYRNADSSTITMTVFDAAGNQLGSTSLADTTYDSGTIGWYNWYAAADWHADSWFDASDGGDGGSSGTVVDDFEDADLTEYAFDRGSSGASVVSSPTHSGSYALQYGETSTEAISTSGLNAYPSAGDTFSFWVRASGGANNLNVTWGVQDHQNRYYAKLEPSAGDFYLFTYKNGSGADEDYDTSLSLSQDAWYEIEIDWQTDGTQIGTLYDSSGTQLSQLSMTDTAWSSGGVGYDAYLGSGEFVYFDEVTIE